MPNTPAPTLIACAESVDPNGEDNINFEIVQWPDGAIQIAAGESSDETHQMRTILQFAADVDSSAAIAMFAAMANIGMDAIRITDAYASALSTAMADAGL